MRKTFKLFCAAAMAALAVSSCGKIWDELDDVQGQLNSIEARLDSLETSLNGQVATINTTLGTLAKADEKLAADIAAVVADVEAAQALLEKLDAADGTINGKIDDLAKALAAFETDTEKAIAEVLAKIAVVNVEKNKAGNYVLTFADGSTLEVSPADPNANNTGLVTVVDGKWAVVGADGKTTVLDAEVHPDTKIDFKVEENTLFVSYDGGKTWEKTDVVVNDKTTINVVEDFKYTEGDDFVTVTVGGKAYVLPIYKADNSSLTFGRTEAYFAYGASKKLALVSEGIEEYYIMSKPDGWKANIEDGKVVVTAPTTLFIEVGLADAKGELLIHATTETGTCKVVKIDLVSGPGLVLSYADDTLSYFNALAGEQTNFWGDVWYDFQDVWFGLLTVDELLEYGSFEAYMASQPEPIGGLQTTLMNIFQTGYEEGVYEEFEAEITLEELVEESWCGYELEEGETYVLWAVPSGDSTTPWLYEQAVYVVTETYVDFVKGEAAYNNVEFEATFFGADGFAVGATSKTAFDDWGVDEEYTYEMALEEFLVGFYMPGPLMSFNDGDHTAMGKVYRSGSFDIDLEDILLPDYGQVPPVNPDTEYFVWVLPFVEGKADYTFEDLQIVTCKTNPLTYNASLLPTVTIDSVAFDAAVITIVPPAGGETAWELVTADDFSEYVDSELGDVDTDAIAEYLSWNFATDEEYTEEYGEWYIEPNTEYVVMTYTTAAGEYSVSYVSFTTPEDPSLAVATPNSAQWMFKSEAFDEVFGGGATPDYLFDLNVSIAELYGDTMGLTACLAVDYEDIYGAEAAGFWAAPVYSSHTVTPDDETSGVVTFSGMEIPYSDLTETTCKFDFSEFFQEDAGTVVVEATLVETPIVVSPQ